jgi:hypothetical protein
MTAVLRHNVYLKSCHSNVEVSVRTFVIHTQPPPHDPMLQTRIFLLLLWCFCCCSAACTATLATDTQEFEKTSVFSSRLTHLWAIPGNVSISEQNTKQCDTCVTIMTAVVEDVRIANRTVETLAPIVEALCEKIGGKIVGAECRVVLDNLERIINWIEAGGDAKSICTKLGFCQSTPDIIIKITEQTCQCTGNPTQRICWCG